MTDAPPHNFPRTRLGHLHAQRYFSSPFADLPAGHTYTTAMAFDAPFDRVRLVYANDSPAPYFVQSASIAAATQLGDGVNPDCPWTRVTFKSGGAPTEQFVAESPNTLRVPGTPNPNLPSLAYSDWIDVAAQTGQHPWLMCRSTFSGPARCVMPPPPGFALFNNNPSHPNRQIHSFHAAGHIPFAQTITAAAPYPFITPHEIQVRTRIPGATILCIGDSLTSGLGSASIYSGWGLRAIARLSTPTRPLFYQNLGWAGQINANFIANARTSLTALAPQIVCIAAYSPNDIFEGNRTQTDANASFNRALTLAHQILATGNTPILTTPLPWCGNDQTLEPIRQSIATRIRTLNNPNIPILDFDRELSNAGNFHPNYNSGDNLHPNDAGYNAMANLATSLFRQLIGG